MRTDNMQGVGHGYSGTDSKSQGDASPDKSP
jgi:hypothetical protein